MLSFKHALELTTFVLVLAVAVIALSGCSFDDPVAEQPCCECENCTCDPCDCVNGDCCQGEDEEQATLYRVTSQGFIPQPPQPPGGLDPIAQTLLREREERYAIEQRLDRLERLCSIQVRQIQQLQRIAFGIGRSGVNPGSSVPTIGALPDDASEPIETPIEFDQIGQEPSLNDQGSNDAEFTSDTFDAVSYLRERLPNTFISVNPRPCGYRSGGVSGAGSCCRTN